MPVTHKKVSPAPPIGGPNTITTKDWNDNMQGSGGGDQLPLLRKAAHTDGMEFALTAQEARDGINVYSREEVNNLIGGSGLPPGGTTYDLLQRTSPTTSGWTAIATNTAINGIDGSGHWRALTVNGGNVALSDNTRSIYLQGHVAITSDKVLSGTSGRWIVQDRSGDGEMVYAYNTNCCFNEAAGRAWFHRNVTVSGDVNIGGTLTVNNFPGGGGNIRAWAYVVVDGGVVQTFHAFGFYTYEALSMTQVRLYMNAGVPSGHPVPVSSGGAGAVAESPSTIILYGQVNENNTRWVNNVIVAG